MSLINCMNIAQQGLTLNQNALSIVSNNISNMNTPGYHKQRAELSTVSNYNTIGNNVYQQIGSAGGAQIDGVLRYSDMYLQNYFREQNSSYAYLNQASQISSNIENLMNELGGTGLQKSFTAFYDAVNALQSNPTDSTARLNFMQQAKTVAQKFNEMSGSLDDFRTSLVGDVTKPGTLDQSKASITVDEINQKLQEIAKVNKDILRVSSGGMQPNNLLDTRDALIDQLSALVPLEITENKNGTVDISMGGTNLLKGTEVQGTLSVKAGDADNPVSIDIVDKGGVVIADNVNSKIKGGSLGAILDMGSSRTDILTPTGVLNQLNQLAAGFAQIVNDIQTGTGSMAIDKDTMTLIQSTENIFQSKDGGAITAGNIQINDVVLKDPYLVAAAKVDPLDFDPKAIGNGNNMTELTKTRTGSFAGLGNANPEGFLTSLVGDIGLKTESVKNSFKNQNNVMREVATQLNSVTGVNLDEELIDLTKFQRAYEASARVFNTCNDILQLLVNLGQ